MAVFLLLYLSAVVTCPERLLPGGLLEIHHRVAVPAVEINLTPGGQDRPTAIQQKKESQIDEGAPVIKQYTEMVSLTVTVTDSHDRLVPGLDRNSFEVYDNKVKQNIEYFSDEDFPISVGILIDVSGSLYRYYDRAIAALKAFVQKSHNDDDFFLITFNQRPVLVAEGADGETLIRKIEPIIPDGETALYDAVYLGAEKAKEGRHKKRALLIISDGRDNHSRYKDDELLELLREADVQIYCIGIGDIGSGNNENNEYMAPREPSGQEILAGLARVTGGRAFFPWKDEEMVDAAASIALELRRQYSIGYYPTDLKRDGKWHKIKVRVNSPPGRSRLRVRAKEGYYPSP